MIKEKKLSHWIFYKNFWGISWKKNEFLQIKALQFVNVWIIKRTFKHETFPSQV